MTTSTNADAVVALVDGEQGVGVPATDSSVLRGDGCFEAIRVYDGRPFRLDAHLDRLARSASTMSLPVPDRDIVVRWVERVVAGRESCVVRIVLTRGPAVPGEDGLGRCVVVSHPVPPVPPEVRLWPVPAPWHPAGRRWELSGAKTISYAPNLAAGRVAAAHGATDALLLADDGTVLEGPTFSVGWFKGSKAFTPTLELGILDSITRRVVCDLHPEIEEVRASLDDVASADEVFAMSTIKEVVPVIAVGETLFPPGPGTDRLAQRFAELVEQ